MGRLGMEEGVPIEHTMVSKAIERAQKQVEGRNFETRKHLLEYDDVMNKQREASTSSAEGHPGGQRGARLRPRDRRRHRRRSPRIAPARRRTIRATGTSPACGPSFWPTSTSAASELPQDLDEMGRGAPRELVAISRRATPRRRADRPRDHAATSSGHHAALGRHRLEGPPPRSRPPQGGHRTPRLRPARSAPGIQEGELRALPGDEGAGGERDRRAPLAASSR